jgi:tRNA-2-methylthio-N6-dimethylallyladenosine synthase
VRENADNRLYGNLGHLARCKAAKPDHADRRGRVHGAEGSRHDHRAGSRGWTSCSVPTTSVAARLAGSRSRGNEEAQVEILESLSVFPSTSRPSASRRTRHGSRSGRLQQHLHVLHRALAAGQGEGSSPRRDPRRESRRSWPIRASARSPCWGRTSTPTGWSSVTGRRSPSCCARAGDRGPGAGAVHLPAPGGLHRRRDRGDGQTPNVMPQLHMPLQSGSDRCSRRCAARTAGRSSWASSNGSAPRCPRPPSPPTSSSASRARPRRTSKPPWTSCARPGSRRLHVPVLHRARAPRPRPCPTRSPPRSSRSAISDSSTWSNEIAWAENKKLVVGRTVELMVAEGEGRKETGVGLGMPTVGVPVPLPDAPACR